MSVVHASRPASLAELAAENDRRGAVIERLESDLAAQIAGHSLSAKQATDNLLRAMAAEREWEALASAGKHLAVKLAETYRAAGIRPADCQALRDWMAAIAKVRS